VSFPQKGSQWPSAPIPAFAHQERFAITDNLSDQISYVSAHAQPPLALGNVPVGDNPVELEGPHHITSSPDGKYVYFNLSNFVPGTGSGPHGSHGTGSVPGSVVKLDALTSANIGEALVDRNPGDIVLSKDGSTIYVSHFDQLRVQQTLASGAPPETANSDVAVVDAATMQRLAMIPVCPTAHGMGLSADGRSLYVTCFDSDELAVVDVHDRSHPAVTLKLSVGPTPGPLGTPNYAPYALAVSPADGTVWISDSSDVRVFDPARSAMDGARTVMLAGPAYFSGFSHDGATLYVPLRGNDQLIAVDAATLKTRVLPLPADGCLNAHAFVLAPDGTHGITVCEGDHLMRPGSVVYIDLAAFLVLQSVQVGMYSDGATFLPAL
jgi:DNA-binding beta-propeller fold protein YncE